MFQVGYGTRARLLTCNSPIPSFDSFLPVSSSQGAVNWHARWRSRSRSRWRDSLSSQSSSSWSSYTHNRGCCFKNYRFLERFFELMISFESWRCCRLVGKRQMSFAAAYPFFMYFTRVVFVSLVEITAMVVRQVLTSQIHLAGFILWTLGWDLLQLLRQIYQTPWHPYYSGKPWLVWTWVLTGRSFRLLIIVHFIS